LDRKGGRKKGEGKRRKKREHPSFVEGYCHALAVVRLRCGTQIGQRNPGKKKEKKALIPLYSLKKKIPPSFLRSHFVKKSCLHGGIRKEKKGGGEKIKKTPHPLTKPNETEEKRPDPSPVQLRVFVHILSDEAKRREKKARKKGEEKKRA